MDLERLNKALSTYEVAEHIFKVDDGKTLSECLKIVVDGQEPDPSTIAGAVKITRTKQLEELQPVSSPTTGKNVDNGTVEPALKHAVGHGENSRITLGKNRTPVVMNGKKVTKSSFNDVVNAPHKDFERVINDDELPWIKRNVTADQIAAVKRAVLKSVAARKQVEEAFSVNETAMAILRAHTPLKERNDTIAAKTLVTDGLPSTKELAQLAVTPVETRERSVSELLPSEFAAKQKAGQLRTWNDASKSLKTQPNHEKSSLDDPKSYNSNTNIPTVDGMTRTALPQPNVAGRTRNYVFPDKSNFPNKEKKWDVNLKKPKNAVQNNDPNSSYTGAI